jgi:hypothetical protein
MWILVCLDKLKTIDKELDLKDPRIIKKLKILKFLISFFKNDV